MLARAPSQNLSQRIYNVTSFSLSAEQFLAKVLESFPEAKITYSVHEKRQGIVDTWPMDTDDSHARRDWNWEPDYGLERCFKEFLVPNIRKRYQ